MRSPEQGFETEKEKNIPDVDRALLAAYKSLLFNDSSDYEDALWKILQALDPEIAKKLEAHLADTDKESTKGVELLDELKKRVASKNK
ncbi:MAG: hypothetical protein A2745_02905 [Candidatus Harrisonbacteria bacterium RIFCSPHIGHO2_01_FULL_44_13]|uniref:Uncharacterized protein n=1 Tax=Candidatus Harrisonbacteria bacterium RIFCSPLOWO2_01_FULL_44_18 TaxID=1798407 RepID=A0A1G1ZP70_9BACT|nr:MAG: hypothetical protein A2745_02905 [Candidatus Harrisonbacteria bacterium RIFCSPHIGHO2_01_FULL_44_13]OGY65530.1 MAG: hypothetical protein A3A16_01535 [Candidatus Harrisonbacteria bacterium RIFCSPLOWO2_01_FULL_44_18]